MSTMEFLTVLLLTFGLFMILAGAFTAYFGSGKSRMIGVVLLVVGLVVALLWIYLCGFSDMIVVDLGGRDLDRVPEHHRSGDRRIDRYRRLPAGDNEELNAGRRPLPQSLTTKFFYSPIL